MNHIRFPKEDHLPDWARRDNKVKKSDPVEIVFQGDCYFWLYLKMNKYNYMQFLSLHRAVYNLCSLHTDKCTIY